MTKIDKVTGQRIDYKESNDNAPPSYSAPDALFKSVLAWPLYYLVEHLLLIALVWPGRVAWAFLDKLRSEVSVFCVEYLLVIVGIFVTNALVLRAKRHNLPLQWTRDEAARL